MYHLSRALSLLLYFQIFSVFSCSTDETPDSRLGGTEQPVDSSADDNSNDGTVKIPQPTTSSNIPGSSTTTVSGNCYKVSELICKIEMLITEKTNSYRKQAGVPALVHDHQDAFVARDWSSKQSAVNNIGHDGFPSARETAYTLEFKSARDYYGENVAYNSYIDTSGQMDADANTVAEYFATAWFNSPGHKANMLRASFDKIGVGVVQNSQGEWYATQIFR